MKRVLLLVFSSALLVSACSKKEKAESQKQPAAAAKKRLVLGTNQEPDSLDTMFAEMAASHEILSLGQRELTMYNDQWELVPDLAESVPTIENGAVKIEKGKMKVSWKIKADAVWEDGVPVTADDIIFGWKVCMDSSQEIIDRDTCERMESIDVTSADKKSFTVTWKKPFAFFNNYRVHTIYPAHVLKPRWIKPNGEHANLKQDPYGRKPLSNGPFKFKEWVPGQYITYVKNERFKPEAKLDEVTFQIIPNNQSLESNMIAGSIDAISPTAAQLPSVEQMRKREGDKLKYMSAPGMVWAHIDCNLDNPLLKDVRVRKALAHSINRQKIIDSIYYGKYEISNSFLPPKHWGYDPSIKSYDYDLAKAAALLDEAGFKQKGPGAIRQNAKGDKLSLKIMAVAAVRDIEQFEQILQSDLRSIGVELQIDNKPAKVFFGDIARKRKITDLGFYSWVSDPGGWSHTLWHQDFIPSPKNNWQGQNYPGWRNAEASKLLDAVPAELDPAKRKAMMKRVQELWVEELPAIPVYFRPVVSVSKPQLANYKITGTQTPVTWNAWEWTFSPNNG